MSLPVNYAFWQWDAALSPEFCNLMIEQIDWSSSGAGTVSSNIGDVTNTKIRKTDVLFQDSMQPLGCIARSYIDAANKAAQWGYDLTSQEDTQIGRYKSVDKGFYDWHEDSYLPKDGMQRKLSCVILLSNPSEFEGGQLQLEVMEDQVLLEKQGSIIVFPSFLRHRVTPVTEGTRYTAVVWATGPSFR